MKRFVVACCLMVLVIWLKGCGTTPTSPEPKAVPLFVSTGEDLNPHIDNQAQSVDLLIFYLTSPHKFTDADLTSLYPLDKAALTLGADLVDSQLIRVAPGAQQLQVLQVDPRTRHLGVVAAFEQYHRADWRDIVQLRDDSALDKVLFRNKNLNVTLTGLEITASLD